LNQLFMRPNTPATLPVSAAERDAGAEFSRA
jgi:hypothetical protein